MPLPVSAQHPYARNCKQCHHHSRAREPARGTLDRALDRPRCAFVPPLRQGNRRQRLFDVRRQRGDVRFSRHAAISIHIAHVHRRGRSAPRLTRSVPPPRAPRHAGNSRRAGDRAAAPSRRYGRTPLAGQTGARNGSPRSAWSGGKTAQGFIKDGR